MSFLEFEERDGIRMSWNMWPSTRIEATRMVVPIAGLVTYFLFSLMKVHAAEGETRRCAAVPRAASVQDALSRCVEPLLVITSTNTNNSSQMDFRAKQWICPFCLQRNAFPPSYNIAPNSMPPELLGNLTTIEVSLSIAPSSLVRPNETAFPAAHLPLRR